MKVSCRSTICFWSASYLSPRDPISPRSGSPTLQCHVYLPAGNECCVVFISPYLFGFIFSCISTELIFPNYRNRPTKGGFYVALHRARCSVGLFGHPISAGLSFKCHSLRDIVELPTLPGTDRYEMDSIIYAKGRTAFSLWGLRAGLSRANISLIPSRRRGTVGRLVG